MKRETLLQYVVETYQTQPEYLWRKYPTYAVLRHTDNRKWYGLVMTVPAKSLGLSTPDDETIMDVKLLPEQVETLQTEPGILPAYHMNKSHWVSVRLSRVTADEIKRLLAASYQLTQN